MRHQELVSPHSVELPFTPTLEDGIDMDVGKNEGRSSIDNTLARGDNTFTLWGGYIQDKYKLPNVRRGIVQLVFLVVLIIVTFSLSGSVSAKGERMLEQLKVSYFAIFWIASLAFFLIRAIEFLLRSAGFLKSEYEVQVAEIHTWLTEEGGREQLESLHEWHSPVEHDMGNRFTWKMDEDTLKMIGAAATNHSEVIQKLEAIARRLPDE